MRSLWYMIIFLLSRSSPFYMVYVSLTPCLCTNNASWLNKQIHVVWELVLLIVQHLIYFENWVHPLPQITLTSRIVFCLTSCSFGWIYKFTDFFCSKLLDVNCGVPDSPIGMVANIDRSCFIWGSLLGFYENQYFFSWKGMIQYMLIPWERFPIQLTELSGSDPHQ